MKASDQHLYEKAVANIRGRDPKWDGLTERQRIKNGYAEIARYKLGLMIVCVPLFWWLTY